MQVVMSMEEYEEMKNKIENNKNEENIKKIAYENGQRMSESLLKIKDIEIKKYKKVNDMVIDFFIKNKVSCPEAISQNDRILEAIEDLVINLFEETQKQFLVECANCGGFFDEDDVIRCSNCGEYYCKDDCANELIDGECEYCKDITIS